MSTTMDTTPPEEGLDVIEAALDELMTIDHWRLSDEALLMKMDRLGVIAERAHGIRLATIRAVDERGSCTEIGAYATSDRITLTDRAEPATAKHHVRTAKDLGRYPILQEAVERGQVTREQLKSVLLGLQWIPDTAADEDLAVIQKQLVDYAASHPPTAMRKLSNRLVAVHFPDAEDDRLNDQLERDERRAHQKRSLTWRPDGEGSWFIRLQLPELDATKLKHVISAFTTRPWGLDQKLDPDAEQPTLDQRRADTFVAMVEQFFHPPLRHRYRDRQRRREWHGYEVGDRTGTRPHRAVGSLGPFGWESGERIRDLGLQRPRCRDRDRHVGGHRHADLRRGGPSVGL